MQETLLFLDKLFGDLDPSFWFYTWTLQDKRTHWFQNIDDASKILEPYTLKTAGKDCYVGVSLSNANYGPKVRLKEEEGRTPAGIVGFWADIDFAHTAHKKKALPPTLADAKWLVESCGMPPTVLVNSGHGLQPWWLFKEHWTFEKEAEREKAASLAHAISRLFSRKAAGKGWVIDSVFDLTRVLRLPGTWNHKESEVVQASIVEANWERRYDPEDFMAFNVDEIKVERPKYVCGDLTLHPSANPPIEKMMALLTNSSDFKKTWEHKRGWPSNSEYEFSLASLAVQAMWNDQEIADLLIAHRRQWGPEKLSKLTERKDYIERTISLVRGDKQRDEAIRILAGAIDDPTEEQETVAEPGKANKPDPRRGDLDHLSAVFGLKIARMIQFGTESPIYSIELSNGQRIDIGRVGAITEGPRAFQKAVYAQTRLMMAPIPKKAWAGICDALGRVCDVVEAKDATKTDSVCHLIENYITQRGVYDDSQKDLACSEKSPLIRNGLLHIHANTFHTWANFHSGDRWEKSELLEVMHDIGFQQKTVSYTNDGKSSSRSYWAAPVNLFEEAIPTPETVDGDSAE